MRPSVPFLVLSLLSGCGTAPSGPSAPPARAVELFDGATLDGWRALGDARYTPDDGSILGEVDGGGQSFLITEERYGDFVLEVDVKTELPGNSGIQVRSQLRDDGRLFGYQIEIDPSERAWSGGLYDEARRGWLDSLEGDDEARAAFRPGEWNRYRVECRGAWIRAWVNGVPTADHLDALDLDGVFGLQVHSGNNTRVRWRGLRLTDLGTRTWRPLDVAADSASAPLDDEGGAARFGVLADPARPDELDVQLELAGRRFDVRAQRAPAEGQDAPRPWSVDVLRQGRRLVAQVDGQAVGAWDLGADQPDPAQVVLRPAAGQRVDSAATLARPTR